MKEVLKKTRIENNLTLEQLAQEVGISKVYLWQIENDKRRLSYQLAIKIAKFFDLKPDQLFYDDVVKKIDLSK